MSTVLTINELVDSWRAVGLTAEQLLGKLVGKEIMPPEEESHLYTPSKLRITSITVKSYGLPRINTNEPLLKQGPGGPPLPVFLYGFYPSMDADSIYKKFLVAPTETKGAALTQKEISAVNGMRGRVSCVSCGAQLVPLYGTMVWCPTCERE